MARIFVTGSADGLGLATARTLIEQGHQVVAHARNDRRAEDTRRALPGAAAVLVADLSSTAATEELARQANDTGRFHAVIHNAGVGYREHGRVETPEGHAHVLAVNVLAPYLLTALMTRPDRLVYLSSGMHQGGSPTTYDLDWRERPWRGAQAYSDSKMYDATVAAAVARRWHDVRSNAVDPGWVPTRMGGAGAPDDLDEGHRTQVWLAVSDDPAAAVSGRYLYHRRERQPHPAVQDEGFQDDLLAALADLTGVVLPD